MSELDANVIVNGQKAIATVVQTGTVIKDGGAIDATSVIQTESGPQKVVKIMEVGGGGGGHYVKKPTVVEDLESTSITLNHAKENTIYKYGTLNSLTVSANDTSDEEILIYFTAGATITTSFPNTLQWVNDMPLEAEANTKYVISIVNNIAAFGSFNQEVL